MVKNRRIIYIFLLLFILSCTGCGKNRKTEDSPATADNTEQEAAATATDAENQPIQDEYGFYVVNDYVMTLEQTVNVRTEPSTEANIYKLLEQGSILNRTGYNNEWTRVLLDGESFYVYSEFLTETDAPVQEPVVQATPGDAENGDKRVKKIVIDPCNQALINVSTEEIGPGSSETKQGVSNGSVGTTFGVKESELNLEYAKLLKTELENRGYEVILTREEDNVDLTNKARAELANASGAAAFIRIQMNESENPELNGVMAVCMTKNSPYNSDLYRESRELATRLLQGITEQTSAANRGIFETDRMTAVNWSDIPVAVIDLGFLSNQTDEANLMSDGYKADMIQGLANGIDYYFQ